MSEKDLQSKVKQWIKKNYPTAVTLKLSDMWQSAVPDLYVQCQGTTYWIELKVPGKEPTPFQAYMLKILAREGAVTGVAHSVDGVKRIMAKNG